MILFKKAKSLSGYLSQKKNEGIKTGFVPTMGALHQGHLSLIHVAKQENDLTVCSIFVNPTQFNNPDDFRHYPVTLERDIEKLLSAGCDVLFLPSTGEIYPSSFAPKQYPLGELENILEGFYRPGHYQGVCQVVDRLLEIVQPDNIYLGAKDYQQCKVIAKLLQLLGKENEILIHIEPTLREPDGLAMSSRNLRLTTDQREQAPVLYNVLKAIKEKQDLTEALLLSQGVAQLQEKGFVVDYLQIADADSLLPVSDKTRQSIVLVAASIGNIRLIDNLLLN